MSLFSVITTVPLKDLLGVGAWVGLHKPLRLMNRPIKTESEIFISPKPCIFFKVQTLWPINNILPRADNLTVKNQELSFLFIIHGLDEINISLISH